MGGARMRACLLVVALVLVTSCGTTLACAGCPRWVEVGASAMGRTAKTIGLSHGHGTEQSMKLRGGGTRCQWEGGCRWHTHPSRRGIIF